MKINAAFMAISFPRRSRSGAIAAGAYKIRNARVRCRPPVAAVWLTIGVVFAVLLARIGIDTFSGPGGKATRTLMGTVMILAVYFFGIGLYDAHAAAGQVPVGRLYVLAYGVVVLISLVHPVVTLLVDVSGRVDA